ncbi:hypothetical protein [Streptomyces sp. NBC_00582]|uniref:hypothetical protein n=1 Tax=Streptomyces sp. NBC_00582 TaxID=2975783 RepID=UPI002E814523|nr:hypothetical protein [Streptomyces sp. NBC_00582]WUB63878.1 hypothetical protein OG852_27530 [Streptomyces sp. NBC_00582]
MAATLLRGEVACVLQAAEYPQYKDAYRPPDIPLHEVRRGPYDGHRGAVRPDSNGDLPKTLSFPAHDPRVTYEYDGMKGTTAVYRYAPNLSPAHRPLMDAVAEQYREHAAQEAAKKGSAR